MARRKFKRKAKPRMAKQITSIVKKEIHRNVEDKFHTIGPFTFDISSNPAVPGNQLHLLNGLTRGTGGANERVGHAIRMKSVKIRINIAAGAVPSFLRFTLFRDKIADLTVPILSELYTALTAVTFQNVCNAPLNPNFVPSAFHIYKDVTKMVDVYGGAANLPGLRQITWDVPLNNAMVKYDSSNTGTITDIVRNALFLQISSNVLEADAANRPSVQLTACLMYEDA